MRGIENWHLFRTSVLLAGPTSFILTLLFHPKMLTAYLSGDTLLYSVEVHIGIVGFITAAALLLVFAVSRNRRTFQCVVPFACVGCPVVCAVVLAVVQHPVIPFVVSLLLAVSCAVQLYLFLQIDSRGTPLSLSACALLSSATIGIAALLSHLCYTLMPDASRGSLLISIVMTVTGFSALQARLVGNGVGKIVVSAFREQACRVQSRLAPFIPPVLICSMSLGSAWDDFSFDSAVHDVPLFIGGVAATIGFLALLRFRWAKSKNPDRNEVVQFTMVPAAAGVCASLLSGVLDTSAVFVILVFSNLTFLALVWIEMTYLKFDDGISSSAVFLLPLASLVLLFVVSLLISPVIPPGGNRIIIPLVALAYLVFLVRFFQNTARQSKSVEHRALSIDEIEDKACKMIRNDFKLSKKETEVLFYLIRGLSAPVIGKKLFISHETVKTHKYHIYQKIGVHSFEDIVELFREYVNTICLQQAETKQHVEAKPFLSKG